MTDSVPPEARELHSSHLLEGQSLKQTDYGPVKLETEPGPKATSARCTVSNDARLSGCDLATDM